MSLRKDDEAIEVLAIPRELSGRGKSGNRRSWNREIGPPIQLEEIPLETLADDLNKLAVEIDQIEERWNKKKEEVKSLRTEYLNFPSINQFYQKALIGIDQKNEKTRAFKTRLQTDRASTQPSLVLQKQLCREYLTSLNKGIPKIEAFFDAILEQAAKRKWEEKEWSDIANVTSKLTSDPIITTYPKVKNLLSDILLRRTNREWRKTNFNLFVRECEDGLSAIEKEKEYLEETRKNLVIIQSSLILIDKIQQIFSEERLNARIESEKIRKAQTYIAAHAKGVFSKDEVMVELLKEAAVLIGQRATLLVAKDEEQINILENEEISNEEKLPNLDKKYEEFVENINVVNRQIFAILPRLEKRVMMLSAIEAETMDFIHFIDENIETYRAAYSDILTIKDDFTPPCLNEAARLHLVTIAEKIQNDYADISYSEYDMLRNRVVRERRKCADIQSIKEVKEKYANEYEALRSTLYEHYLNTISKIIAEVEEQIEAFGTDEVPLKADFQSFLSELNATKLDKNELPNLAAWLGIENAREYVDKLSYQLALFYFEQTVLTRIEEVKQYSHNQTYHQTYDDVLQKIKNSIYAKEAWEVLDSDKNAFFEFVKNEKEKLKKKYLERKTFSKPVTDFCEVIKAQIDLIKKDSDSLEKTARLKLLADINHRINEKRELFFLHLIGGEGESEQGKKFKKAIHSIIEDELLVKKGLEKITDVLLRNRLESWFREFLKPLYRYVNKKFKHRYYFTYFKPSQSEKALAEAAEKASNLFLVTPHIT